MPKVIKRGSAPSARPIPSTRPAKKRIIERELVDATREASEILRRAEEEAQRIIEEAQEQADETRQHGYREGREQAIAECSQRLTQALLKVERMTQQLEPQYIALVTACVEKVINMELKVHPDAIVGVVRAALADARQQRDIIVRVNPTDAEALERNRNRLLEVLARAHTIEVRGDAAVRRGGCIIATELGSIDGTLDRQLEMLTHALNDELKAGHHGPRPYNEQSELDPEDMEA